MTVCTVTAMSESAIKREGLRVRKLAGEPGSGVVHTDPRDGVPAKYPLAGVVFLDVDGHHTVDHLPDGEPVPPPKKVRLPADYVQREPWIEVVNPTAVVRNGGSASNPTAKLHTFIHADELVLHMLTGDFRYKVVHQPDKYGADGKSSNAAGDPTTTVDWFYDANLIEE